MIVCAELFGAAAVGGDWHVLFSATPQPHVYHHVTGVAAT
jgi:hypothetical protein